VLVCDQLLSPVECTGDEHQDACQQQQDQWQRGAQAAQYAIPVVP